MCVRACFVYVCMFLCVHMYIHVCACIHGCMRARVHVHMSMHVGVCRVCYVYRRLCAHVGLCVCACAFMCTCECVCVYTCECTTLLVPNCPAQKGRSPAPILGRIPTSWKPSLGVLLFISDGNGGLPTAFAGWKRQGKLGGVLIPNFPWTHDIVSCKKNKFTSKTK